MRATTPVRILVWTLALAPAAAVRADAPGPVLLGPDELVAEVLARLDERLALMPEVAAAKWARGQPI
ncbi:MAG: hypothetical protein JSR54_19760, partial [Proteobacteria bacterium]|nr:hypothetical protein [Pseudomonadota bacterium]